MASNPRKRQKKLERRAAKRKEKKHLQVREQHAGLPDRISAAAKYPILDTRITEDVWTQGMGWVLLSRLLPNGSVAAVVFLVDRYCLGVKNVIVEIMGRFTYDSKLLRQMLGRFESEEVAPAKVRKFIEDAVAYAQKLGFSPHPDYQTAKLIFGDIDASACHETFEFGKDGKPFFISGPSDTPARSRQIYNTLLRSCGPGNFDYLLQVGPDEGVQIMGPDEEDEMFLEDEEDYYEDEDED
jgi:hypothetical protein